MKNKEKIQLLEHRLNTHSELLERITSKLEFDDEPKLKQLDQSVFNGLDSKWKYAAVDADGDACIYTHHMTPDSVEFTYCDYMHFDCEVIGTDYDTTNWKNSLIKRESKPQLKQLDHSIFDGLDEKWRFAAVDSDGSRAVFTSDNITQTYGKHYVNARSGEAKQVLGRVDASNWQNSLIERDDITKELLDVDLNSELTGSELCKAMLARGDKVVTCFCGDTSDEDAIAGGTYDAITQYRDNCTNAFESSSDIYECAVPVNNHGKPLTSRDVGLY